MPNNIVNLAENVDVVDMASNLINNPNTTSIALVGLASLLYSKVIELNRVAPIKDVPGAGDKQKDKTRYDDLCHYRKELEASLQRIVGKKNINAAEIKVPEQWELNNEDRPIYTSSFMANHKKIVKIGEEVNGVEFPQSTLIASIIAKIGGLFSSLGKRYQWGHPDRMWTYQNYSPNNFEAMFFSDLVYLMSHHILMAPSDKAREVTLALIEYCKKVRRGVLFDRGADTLGLNLNENSQRHEPLTVLDDILSEMDVLAKNFNKEYLARTFNDQINQINVNFIKLIREAFSILHLLLNDTNDYNFQVDTFLKEYKENDVNNKIMEDWIYKTLKMSSIKSGDYESKEKISLDNVAELPHVFNNFIQDDRDLIRAGFWHFIIRDNLVIRTVTDAEIKAASSFLKKVQSIHKLIIKLCFVRQSIIILSKVSAVFGEAWLYGEDEGKEPLCVMLAIITEITKELQDNIIDSFWDSYSAKYVEFKTGNNQKIESSDPESKKYYSMEEGISKIKSLVVGVTDISGKIKEKISKVTELENTGRTDLSNLLRNLINYVEVTKLEFENHEQLLQTLKRQLSSFEQINNQNINISTTPVEQNNNTVSNLAQSQEKKENQGVDKKGTIKLIDAATLATFNRICTSLFPLETSSSVDLSSNTRIFMDLNQRSVYNSIIAKHQAEIESYRNPYWMVDSRWWYYHAFNNKIVKNTPKFIEFCVNLMKAIEIINPSTNVRTQTTEYSKEAMSLFNTVLHKYIVEQDRRFHFGINSSLTDLPLTRVSYNKNKCVVTIVFGDVSLELPLDEQSERIAALFQDDYDRILATEEKLKQAGQVITEKSNIFEQKEKEYENLETEYSNLVTENINLVTENKNLVTKNKNYEKNQNELSNKYNDLKKYNEQLLKTLAEQNNALQKTYINGSYMGYIWSFFSSESQVAKKNNIASPSSTT